MAELWASRTSTRNESGVSRRCPVNWRKAPGTAVFKGIEMNPYESPMTDYLDRCHPVGLVMSCIVVGLIIVIEVLVALALLLHVIRLLFYIGIA